MPEDVPNQYRLIDRAQDDLFVRLRDDSILGDWGVHKQDDGAIDWEMKRDSLLWRGRDGETESGAAVVVGMPTVGIVPVESGNPPLKLRIPVSIFEAPQINRDPNYGTEITSTQAVGRIIQLINCLQTVGLSGGWYVEQQDAFSAAVPFEITDADDDGWRIVGYQLFAVVDVPNESIVQCRIPTITEDGGNVTITAEAGDTIRYTTDESYPSIEGGTAQDFAAPFPVPGSGVVRALAYRVDCIPSSVALFSTEIEGENIGTEGDDSITTEGDDKITTEG